MDKLYYPAIMHPEEDGGYSIWLPDISGCVSQGETEQEAVENIKDALGLYYEEAEEGNLVLPVPSVPDQVPLEPGESVKVVEFSPSKYLSAQSVKTIKKTLPTPIATAFNKPRRFFPFSCAEPGSFNSFPIPIPFGLC